MEIFTNYEATNLLSQRVRLSNRRAANSMRGAAGRGLLKPFIDGRPLRWRWRLRPLATATKKPPASVRDQERSRAPESAATRDDMILEMFKHRQLKGPRKREPEAAGDGDGDGDGAGHTKVVSCFEELGLSEEVVGAAEEMGVVVPSEVQCLGVPVVLEGKSMVLIGPPESGRTWAYLLPLIQSLRKDAADFGRRWESPRAFVLCPSEELCDKVFCAAKLITSQPQLKPVAEAGLTGESGHKDDDASAAPIGMLVGTPEEILQQITDGLVVLTDIRYLVLDEADIMLDSDLLPKIHEIFSLLNNSTEGEPSLQTILIASTNEKMLANELVESIERTESGEVTAMILEMDRAEVHGLFKSADALRKRVAEALRSLGPAPSSS